MINCQGKSPRIGGGDFIIDKNVKICYSNLKIFQHFTISHEEGNMPKKDNAVYLIVLDKLFFNKNSAFIYHEGVDCTSPFFSQEIGRTFVEHMFKQGTIGVKCKNILLAGLKRCGLPEEVDVYDYLMPQVLKVDFIAAQISEPATIIAAQAGDPCLIAQLYLELHQYISSCRILAGV